MGKKRKRKPGWREVERPDGVAAPGERRGAERLEKAGKSGIEGSRTEAPPLASMGAPAPARDTSPGDVAVAVKASAAAARTVMETPPPPSRAAAAEPAPTTSAPASDKDRTSSLAPNASPATTSGTHLPRMHSVRVGAPNAAPERAVGSGLPAAGRDVPAAATMVSGTADPPVFEEGEIDASIDDTAALLTPSEVDEQLVALGIEEPPLSEARPRARLALGPVPGRVLVTGGAGYFGGILARFLADRGIEVVSLDRLADPDPDPRIVEVVADLRHADEIGAVLADQGPFDAIFHCAALMGHESPDPKDLWEANARGTEVLADAAIAAGVRKLVYTSSICVFGRPYDHPVTEDEPVCPIELYGRSKLEGERILAERADRLDADAIRCPTIVSAGRLGLLAILFEFAREGRRIYLVGDGSNRYSFIHAEDLAEACLLAARAPGSHVYNVGSDDVKPLREVYAGVIEEAGSSSRLARLPEKLAMTALSLLHKIGLSPLGPYHSRLISGTFVFDTTRIKQDLGWRPTRTNEEMLREAYRFYAANEAERSDDLSAHRQGAKMGILRLVKWLS